MRICRCCRRSRRLGNLAHVNKPLIIIVLALLLLGCKTLPPQDAPPAGSVSTPVTHPAEASAGPPGTGPLGEFDSDLLYSYLVAEIGAQRGRLDQALTHYLHAAELVPDPYAAERASRIALHLGDYPKGIRAATRWIAIVPDSMPARQLMILLYLRAGRGDDALIATQALIDVADAQDHDGYVQVAGIISGEQDQDAVIALLQSLQAAHPEEPRVYYAMAIVAARQHRYSEAAQSLREGLRMRPDWIEPRVLLGSVLTAAGDADGSLQLLRDSVAAYPDNTLLRGAYARALVEASEYAAALVQYREMRRLSPDNAEVLFGLAMLATQERQWDEARKAWESLRGDTERANEALYYLAQVEAEDGHPQRAMELYAQVDAGLRLDARVRLAGLKAAAGDVEGAQQILRDARVTDSAHALELYLAETRLLQEYADPATCLALYEEALRAFPDNDDLFYNRALYVADLGQMAWFERDIGELLRRDPDNADALNAYGYTLAERGERLDEARGYIERANALKPDSAAILDSLGWVHFRQGDLAPAVEYLRQALALEPDDEIAAHLGEVLWISGAHDEAREVWRQALESFPDSKFLKGVFERLKPGL